MPGRCRAFCQGKAAGSSLPVGSAVAPSLPRLLRAPLSHFLPAAAPPSSLPAPRAAQGHGGEEQRACREAGEKRLSRAYGTRPCPGVSVPDRAAVSSLPLAQGDPSPAPGSRGLLWALLQVDGDGCTLCCTWKSVGRILRSAQHAASETWRGSSSRNWEGSWEGTRLASIFAFYYSLRRAN